MIMSSGIRKNLYALLSWLSYFATALVAFGAAFFAGAFLAAGAFFVVVFAILIFPFSFYYSYALHRIIHYFEFFVKQ